METRTCVKCGETKLISEFRMYRRSKSNTKIEHRTACFECENAAQRNRYKNDPVKYREIQKKYVKNNPEQVTKTRRKYVITHREKVNMRHLKWMSDEKIIYGIWTKRSIRAHIENGYYVDIDLEKLTNIAKDTRYCSMCGKMLKWTYGKGCVHNSPTVDRINNDRGMTMDNIWIICKSCNGFKGKKKMQDIIAYCKTIVEKCG